MSQSGNLKTVVIVGAARTPIGSFGGSLSQIPATQLGSVAISGAINRAGISPDLVEACYMGNVLTAGVGQAPARQAALGAGLSKSCPCTTVNKVCASGLKAVTMAASDISLNLADIVVAGGMESMSQVPHYVSGERFGGLRLGNGTMVDGIIHDGLFDPYDQQHMGLCAEACAKTHAIPRDAQDAHASESYSRALSSWEHGLFRAEVEPVPLPGKKGRPVGTEGGVNFVTKDEECYRYRIDGLTAMRPVFIKDGSGTVTSGNASGLNDGAAALLLMSEDKAKELNLQPLARIVSYADAATEPVQFTTAPSLAIPKALKRAQLRIEDVDVFEINEAFSVVAAANMKLLGLSEKTVNVWGGAVSMGHPIGCSGARILVTLLSIMTQKNHRRGVAAICNGGGGASAIVVERDTQQNSNL